LTTIHSLGRQPAARLAEALERFESEFRYPLGQDRWFRISHAEDYTCFFRAIGDARVFVAEDGGQIQGVVSAAICRLRQPDGQFTDAAYVADLKLSASADRRNLLRLLRALTDWVHREVEMPGFSVVMDGTARNPTSYSGRLGIPPFQPLCPIMILRVPCDSHATDRVGADSLGAAEAVMTSVAEARDCFYQLQSQHFATTGGEPAIRSCMEPTGLIVNQGAACGVLEDTRRAKLLFRDDGAEMVSAHLSSVGYRSVDDAARLILAAANWCGRRGLPAVFVALPAKEGEAVLKLLPQDGIVKAPATVFGFGLPPHAAWSVNTSEI
jgi:hypothetical protein